MKRFQWHVNVELPTQAGERGSIYVYDRSPEPTGTNGCLIFEAMDDQLKVMAHQAVAYILVKTKLEGPGLVQNLVKGLEREISENQVLREQIAALQKKGAIE